MFNENDKWLKQGFYDIKEIKISEKTADDKISVTGSQEAMITIKLNMAAILPQEEMEISDR
jgi:hypothetical protein